MLYSHKICDTFRRDKSLYYPKKIQIRSSCQRSSKAKLEKYELFINGLVNVDQICCYIYLMGCRKVE